MNCRVRRGFTLVELLVVIAIIGVLIALLLPAIQAAREAARRSNCSNNLKQVTMAVLLYSGEHKKLPVAALQDSSGTTGYAWVTLVLPYMEERALHKQIDFKTYSLETATRPIASLFCPSADAAFALPTGDVSYTNPATGAVLPCHANHYCGVLGPHFEYSPSSISFPFSYNGVTRQFQYRVNTGWAKGYDRASSSFNQINSRLPPYSPAPIGSQGLIVPDGCREKDCIDGLSNTYMIGEMSQLYQIRAWTRGFVVTGAYYTMYQSNTIRFCAIYPPVNGLSADPANDPATWTNCRPFGSKHPRGCHFAMGDGSVRFVTQEVEPVLHLTLASRDGGHMETVFYKAAASTRFGEDNVF